MKVVFLDRDGIINVERGEYTFKIEDLKIVPDLLESALLFYNAGYKFIIISNQGGISKGIYSKKEVLQIDNILRKTFVEKGMEILDSFYCPHYDGIENCLCRKPKSLMLEKALAKYDIQNEDTLFIGDSERDRKAGESLSIKSYLVKANSSILKLSNLLLNE